MDLSCRHDALILLLLVAAEFFLAVGYSFPRRSQHKEARLVAHSSCFRKTRSTMCDRLFNRRDCCPIPSVYFARVAVIYMHHTLKFPPDYFCDSDLVAYTSSPNDSRIYRSTRISNIIFIYFEFCTAFRAILPKIFTHYGILRSFISLSKRNVE